MPAGSPQTKSALMVRSVQRFEGLKPAEAKINLKFIFYSIQSSLTAQTGYEGFGVVPAVVAQQLAIVEIALEYDQLRL